MKKLICSLLCLLLACSCLSGCGGDAGAAGQQGGSDSNAVVSTENNTAASEGTGNQAGRTNAKFAMANETSSLDPGAFNQNWSNTVYMQIYDTLLREAPDDRTVIKPLLAESYEFINEGYTLRFRIKENVQFHNGAILTTDDVEYSLNKAIAMPSNASLSSMMDKAEKVDEHYVDLHLKYPFKPILNILAYPTFAIVNKEWYENTKAEGYNVNTTAMGTGPYEFVEWRRGDKIVLKAFANYHGGEPAIKDLEFVFLTDGTTAAIAVEKGTVDAYLGVSSADLARLRTVDSLICHSAKSSGFYYVAMNCEEGPMADVRVRQALQYALNADEVLAGGMDGMGWTINCCAPIGCAHYQEDFVPSRNDREKAKALLKEAGYENGVDVTFKVCSYDDYLMSAQVIQEQARLVGINMEFIQMEETTFVEEIFTDRDFDCYYYWVGCQYPDIDSTYWRLFHSDSIVNDNTSNVTVLDDLLYQARVSMDDAERYELYRQITEENDENVWYIPMIMSTNTIVATKDLGGVYGHNASLYRVSDWSF